MITFDSFQTVPITSLRDLDPFMQIRPQEKTFPIPGEAFHFVRLDLSKAIIKNPASTFFIQITNDSMKNEGYLLGDVLIVDQMMDPRTKGLAVVYFEGEFIFCRLEIGEWGIRLHFSHPELSPIGIEPEMEFQIWGMVRDVLHMDGKVLE